MPELSWMKDKKVEEIEDKIDEREVVRLDKWGKNWENTPIQRVSSGISGLDSLMENGFPKGSNIIVSGLQGTGKSTFAMQFIAEGCKKGEKCLYITIEQSPPSIIKQALQYQWPYPDWEKQGILQFAYLNFKKPMSTKIFEYIIRTVEQDHWDRMVMDSISALMNAQFSVAYNKILELFEKTAEHGVTTVCVAQKDDKNRANEFIEYLGDGVLLFEKNILGQTPSRTITIDKLRWTKIIELPNDAEFTINGLAVKG
ncbi:MAG: AAA family ATPase [Candidatus Thermoplasmatota archaeon]|nr:AAA family ATPase [Candidatus Thermoplasmatota archaeon]